jgi:maleylpyruvate isomerase
VRWGLEALETFLKPHAGKFSFGDEVTAADCCLVPQMFGAERFKVPTKPYPTLERIAANCSALEAFKKASPAQQPDFPKA